MLPKQIAYTLMSVIVLLSAIFGFSIYSNYKKNQNSEEKISAIISQFEEKFKNDSIYLANANKLLIDKISQHIIDSVSTAYGEKLERAIQEAKKYKQLLIANSISIETSTSLNTTNNLSSPNIEPSNITTYSKLNNFEIKKVNANQFNITTVSKLDNKRENKPINVTTYSKIDKQNKAVKKNTLSITTYNKLNKKNVKHSRKDNSLKSLNSKNNLIHNNYDLDHAKNINDLKKVPIYRGCENLQTEDERKNCFAINISKHIINKFNSLNIQNSELKKGIHKVRVLFVINNTGKAKIGKLVGKWPHQIYKNAKTSVESIPIMSPGYSNNKAISVKYSLLIPFIIQ